VEVEVRDGAAECERDYIGMPTMLSDELGAMV